MTRSIFDPTGGDTEQSGSRNLGPAAKDISHLPPRYNGEEEDVAGQAADAERDAANPPEAQNGALPDAPAVNGKQKPAG